MRQALAALVPRSAHVSGRSQVLLMLQRLIEHISSQGITVATMHQRWTVRTATGGWSVVRTLDELVEATVAGA